jgi:hypothetical protein
VSSSGRSPAADQPGAAEAQADHSFAEAAAPAGPAPAEADHSFAEAEAEAEAAAPAPAPAEADHSSLPAGNVASVPNSLLRFFQFLIQFVSWIDNVLSSCSVSRAVGRWLSCRQGRGSVVSVEVLAPFRAYRSTAPGARGDLQGLQALDSGDAPGPLQAHLPLRDLPPQPARQDILLGLPRRSPFSIRRVWS